MQKHSKLSPHNQKVFDLLIHAHVPLSAYDILDKLRRFGFRSPPTVYRALDALVKQGLVHRIETINAFVACHHEEEQGQAQDHASPFVLCTACGMVQEVEDASLMKRIKKLGSGFLARINKEVFELSGICHACEKKQHSGA